MISFSILFKYSSQASRLFLSSEKSNNVFLSVLYFSLCFFVFSKKITVLSSNNSIRLSIVNTFFEYYYNTHFKQKNVEFCKKQRKNKKTTQLCI